MKNAPRAPLSKAEMEVARIVWRLERATVRQVFEAMPEQRAVGFKTVQTFLRRLETKGYLRARREGRSKVYSPRVRPSKAVKEAVEDFMDRLFSGEALPLIQHLIEGHKLSASDIRKLREMLKRLEAEKK